MQLLSTLSTIAAIPLGKVARIATPPAFAPLLAALGVSESGVDGETRQVAAVPGKRLPVDPAGVTPEMLGFVPAPIPLAAPPPVVAGSVVPAAVGNAPRSASTDVRTAPAPSTGPSAPVGGEASLPTTPVADRTAPATPEPGISGKPDDRPAPDLLLMGANTGPRVNDVGARPEGIVESAADIGSPLEARAAAVAGVPPAIPAYAVAAATEVPTISHAPSAVLPGASVVAADRAAPSKQAASTGATSSPGSALATSSTVGTASSGPTMPVPVPGGPTVAPSSSRHREPMPDDALRALIASLPLIDAPRPPVGGVSGATRPGQTAPIARRGTDLPFEVPVAGNAAIQLPIVQAPVATPPVATPATEASFAASAVAPSPNDSAPRPPMAGETVAPRVVVASSVVASAPPVEPMIAVPSIAGALTAGTSTTDASAAGPTAAPTDAGTTGPVPPPPTPPRPQMMGEAVAPRIAIAAAPREAGVAPVDRRERERDSVGTIAAPAPIDLTPRPVAATAAAERPALDTRDGAWMQGMIDRIETLRSEGVGGMTRIRLSPDALGAIEVSIQPGDDGMQVRFASDNPDAARLLADAQPKLAELAEARGLKLGAMQVDVGQHSQQQPRREAPAQQNFRSRPAHAATPARPDEPTTDDVRIA